MERQFEHTPDGLYQGNPDYADDYQVLLAAANERRLPGGSLVASVAARESALANGQSLTAAGGGWCAPSTTQYGLCAAETLDGIVEVAEVGETRGGINYTEGPDFVDIYTGAGFSQTEAEAIAGETKDCVDISCPDFDEVRMDAVGICVRAPLLTRAAYPELIERWVNGTVVANAHEVWRPGRVPDGHAARRLGVVGAHRHPHHLGPAHGPGVHHRAGAPEAPAVDHRDLGGCAAPLGAAGRPGGPGQPQQRGRRVRHPRPGDAALHGPRHRAAVRLRAAGPGPGRGGVPGHDHGADLPGRRRS